MAVFVSTPPITIFSQSLLGARTPQETDLPEWFVRDVLGAKKPVIVIFGMTGCPPCIRLRKQMLQIRDQHPDTSFVYIDVNQEPGLFQRFGEGPTVPITVLFNEKGIKVASRRGREALEALLKGDTTGPTPQPEERNEKTSDFLKMPPSAEHQDPVISDVFVREVNHLLKGAGLSERAVHLTATPSDYLLRGSSNEVQNFTEPTQVIEAINKLVAASGTQRSFPLFQPSPFWGQPAWQIDLEGKLETDGSSAAEKLFLTSRNNARTWTFDYEDRDFQEKAGREAFRILRQFDLLLSLPEDVLAGVRVNVTSDPNYPLRERLVEYRKTLVELLQNVPHNIADIHQKISFSDSLRSDAEIEPLKLAYRLSYRYQNMSLFDRDISPTNFAQLFHTRITRVEESKAVTVENVVFHHPASFRLALHPELENDPTEMQWNLQMLADWLRFLAIRGFEIGLVNNQIVVRLNEQPVMKFFLRDRVLVERWSDPAKGEWQEASVGEVQEASALVTHDANRPWGLATFQLPDSKRLPPIRILSLIPQMGTRDKHPTALEKQADENAARWLNHLVINLADWKGRARGVEKKKEKTHSADVESLPKEGDRTSLFVQQLEDGTLDWVQKLLQRLEWGSYEVSFLVAQEKNLPEGLRLLLGREPTPVEIARMTETSMGMNAAGRWETFNTKEGMKNILWVSTPSIMAHESGHDFFVSRSIDSLIDNQWHSVSLLFPREEDYLGYYKLVQDYFTTQRDYRDGGSGNIPTDGGCLTDISSGNLGAVITSIHGGLSYVLPSAYSLWGDIPPYSELPRLKGQEYAAELWEQQMNKGTLAGVVYHATDPHEVGTIGRFLSHHHQENLQQPINIPPPNPFTSGVLLQKQVPMDELRSYQTYLEVLESNDPRTSRRQRLRAIARFAPDILRNGLMAVRAVRLHSPHEGEFVVAAADNDPTLHVGAFLVTPEQDRLLRSQNYEKRFASIDMAEGEVAEVGTPRKKDGAKAAADFHFGETMNQAAWVGGSVTVAPTPVEEPKQQTVYDNRPVMPADWFPFKKEQKRVAIRKDNRELPLGKTLAKLGETPKPPQKTTPPPPVQPPAYVATVQESTANESPLPQEEKKNEKSGFKLWMLLAAPLAPLYPAYALLKKSGKKKDPAIGIGGPILSGEDEMIPLMESSALLCIDPRRAQRKKFEIGPMTYQSILPMLTEYELYERYDPEAAYDILKQLRGQGVDPDYLISCFVFPLGETLLAEENFRQAFSLYSWAASADRRLEHSAALQSAFTEIAARIMEVGDLRWYSIGWDALRRARSIAPRTPESIRLTADYLIWKEGAQLKPQALLDIFPDLTATEREVATKASFDWLFDSGTDLQISALKNGWVWLDNPEKFVAKVLHHRRKEFIEEELLGVFMRQLAPTEADLFVRLWFEKKLQTGEYTTGLNWIRKIESISVKTHAAALKRGVQMNRDREELRAVVANLDATEKQELQEELRKGINWKHPEKSEAFYTARALALYFPEWTAGVDALIDGYLQRGWPEEERPDETKGNTIIQFQKTLGLEYWNDLPDILNRASSWIDQSLEGEGEPIHNVNELYNFYQYLYGEIHNAKTEDLYFLHLAILGISFDEGLLPLLRLPKMNGENLETPAVRARLLKLITKLDRKRAEYTATLVPPPAGSPPEDHDLETALILNALHEPWDYDFPKYHLEGRHPETIRLASIKFRQILEDSNNSDEMRLKAALILCKWNQDVLNVHQILISGGLTDEATKWGQLLE